ncbi:hypothetical protein SteCoe_4814 [Stentor coeruleus]|uniref:Uncharacterized protein n=1 Tax=Stentor coeruleus TaxID=5963 RepID=A0A1R2CU15_9CILI|nr:hypothetical protein SteCoe_4814 [Stentor coeruleus]
MGGNHSEISDPEIQSHLLLLKAHTLRKNNLKYEINQLKIHSAYVRYNSDFQKKSETFSISKKLINRIEALKKTKLSMNRLEKSAKIFEVIDKCSKSYNEIKKTNIHEEFSEQEYLELKSKKGLLEEKLDNLKKKLAIKQEIYKKNRYWGDAEKKICKQDNEDAGFRQQSSCETESSISDKEDHVKICKECPQIPHIKPNTLNKQIEFFSINKEAIVKNNSFLIQQNFNISKQVQNVKKCLQLPEKTIYLMSKLLLKEEMQRKIDFVKQNIEFKQEIIKEISLFQSAEAIEGLTQIICI